jgi:YvrJ protein family
MESWMSLVSEVGLPVMVTLYLLHRIEQKLDTLNDTILQLPDHLNAKTSDKPIEP